MKVGFELFCTKRKVHKSPVYQRYNFMKTFKK